MNRFHRTILGLFLLTAVGSGQESRRQPFGERLSFTGHRLSRRRTLPWVSAHHIARQRGYRWSGNCPVGPRSDQGSVRHGDDRARQTLSRQRRIIVKGHEGFVEEIGLRSTKIRAMDNHVISIPNDQIADAEIENIGKRQHITQVTELLIPVDTAREKVEAAVESIREILDNHQGMTPQFPPRVHFADFRPDALRIQVVYWYAPPDQWEFVGFNEKVNLQICTALEERGIRLAQVPSNSV